MTRPCRTVVLGLLALLWSTGMVQAQSCNFTIANVNFGPIDVTTNAVFPATATFQATCTGIGNRIVRICPNLGSGTGDPVASNPRIMLNGSTRMSYNLFHEIGYATIWGSNLWPFTPRPPTIDLQLSGGAGSTTRTIFASVPAGQQTLPAGTYTTSFAGGHTLISYAYSTAGTCATIGAARGVQVPFTVSATNTTTCRVLADDIAFPTSTLLNANVDQTGSLTTTCTNGTLYRIGLGNGLTGTGPASRLMTRGGEDIVYGLYRNALRNQPWGTTAGVDTVSATGSGLGQAQTVYGRVPSQPTPSPGVYSDSVVVTVTY